MLLQDDDDARGRRHLLEGVVQALLSCLMSNRGNPRPSSMVQAVSSLWRRPLLGGTVRVALGVLWRQSQPRLIANWSVGVSGAMYTGINISWAMPSSGPVRSCCSLADLWRYGGLYVDLCLLELGFASSVLL
jgi:hypothetical protein